jgi:hypothetical protein
VIQKNEVESKWLLDWWKLINYICEIIVVYFNIIKAFLINEKLNLISLE